MSSNRDLVLPLPTPSVKTHDYFTLYGRFLTDSDKKEQQQNEATQYNASYVDVSAGSPIPSEPSSAVSSTRNESDLGASEAEALEVLEALSTARRTADYQFTTISSAAKWEIYPSPQYPVSLKRYSTTADKKGYMLVYEYTISVVASPSRPSLASTKTTRHTSNKAETATAKQDVVEKYTLMMDADTGDINFTPLARAAGHQSVTAKMLNSTFPKSSSSSATSIRAMVEQNDGRIVKQIHNNPPSLRGTWLRFEDAKIMAGKYCVNIREKLVPFFGPPFLNEVLGAAHGPSVGPPLPAQPTNFTTATSLPADQDKHREADTSPLPRVQVKDASYKRASPPPAARTSLLKATSPLLPTVCTNDAILSSAGPARTLPKHRFMPYSQARTALSKLSPNIPKSTSTVHYQSSSLDSEASKPARPSDLQKEQEIAPGAYLPRFSTLISSLESAAPLGTSAYQLSSTPRASNFAPGLALPSSGLVSISSGHSLSDRSSSSVVVQQCYSPVNAPGQAERYAAMGGGMRKMIVPAGHPYYSATAEYSSLIQRRYEKINSGQIEDIKKLLFPQEDKKKKQKEASVSASDLDTARR